MGTKALRTPPPKSLSNDQNDLIMLRSPKQVQERQMRLARRRLRQSDRTDRQQENIDPYFRGIEARGLDEHQGNQNMDMDHDQRAPGVEPRVNEDQNSNGGSTAKKKWVQLDFRGKIIEEGDRPKKIGKLKTTKGMQLN